MAALAELGGIEGMEDFQLPAMPAAPAAAPAPAPRHRPPSFLMNPGCRLIQKQNSPRRNWDGVVREITLGATAAEGGTRSHTVTIGGSNAMPYMHFEGKTPYKPVIAIEIQSRRPDDWSELLMKAWGDVMNDPGDWAKAAEQAGAEVLYLKLSSH